VVRGVGYVVRAFVNSDAQTPDARRQTPDARRQEQETWFLAPKIDTRGAELRAKTLYCLLPTAYRLLIVERC
jgi:hypothetical protein